MNTEVSTIPFLQLKLYIAISARLDVQPENILNSTAINGTHQIPDQAIRFLLNVHQILHWLDTPKKSRGKGSQEKKTIDVSQESVDVSDESEPEPAKKKTGSRSTRGVFIQDTLSAPNPKPVASKLKLKGIRTLTLAKQKVADTMQALKESKKTSRRQPGTRGSSEVTSRTPRVPNESTVVSATSSEETGTKPGVPDEEKVTSKVNVILE
ncbi:hypothetical protein Tco_0745688 [Tanacetum coccineum]